MPNVNPNIYSGGAAVINSAPYTNFAINLMARKAAKEDTLDQYYRSLDSKITPAGMDNRYVPQLVDNENNRRQFYMQNRDKIINPRLDGGKAQTQFNSLYSNSQNIVAQGKQSAEDRKNTLEKAVQLQKAQMLPDNFYQSFHDAYEAPLNQAKPFDHSILFKGTKPYDENKDLQGIQELVKPSITETLGATDPNTFLRTRTTTGSYNPQQKAAIGDIAATKYNTNPGFHGHINNLIEQDSKDENHPLYHDLNEFSKQNFGHEIDINHPEQWAAAYTLKRLQLGNTKSVPEVDMVASNLAKQKNQQAFDLNKLAIEHNNRINEKQTATWKELHPNDADNSSFNNMYGRMKDAVYSVDYKQYKGLPMNRLDNDSQDFVNTFVNKQVHLDKGAKLENNDYYVAPSENGKDVAVYLTKERATALNRPQLVGSFSEASMNPKVNTNKAKQTSIQHANNGNAKKGILD